jgi:RNA polymerase sigma factor (sigma-70 family)
MGMQEAIRQGGRTAYRPTRAEIEPAARELVERHGAQIMGTARRYSLSAEDAEDAFQRGLEILLTKAPSTDQNDLVPWLKTVVKHEAFAIRKQRRRAEPAGDRELITGVAPATHDQAETKERLRLGAEALGRLKPQEVRCLLLRAEGYSYKQICEETGFTYTKVNRCITEGRRAFLDRVAGIESGAECERLAPLLSRLADGEAGAEDMAALRPHLRGCLTCRATLREYRGAPSRIAALVPLLAGPHLVGRALQRLHALIVRGHDALVHAADVASAQKLAAAAAATAAIAGGGVATVASIHPGAHHSRPAHATTHRRAHAAAPTARPATTTTSASVAKPPAARSTQPTQTTASANAKRVAKAQQEFAPSPAAATPTPSRAKPARAAAGGEFGP